MGIMDIFNNGASAKKQGYKVVLTDTGDLSTTDHQCIHSTTEWTTIATYQCPAQQKIAVGYGNPANPENQGRIYAYLRTGEGTPDEITGKIRIIITNYNDTNRKVIFEHDENMLHGSLTDKQQQVPLPESKDMISEDSYIKVQVKPDSAHNTSGAGNDNLGWADSTESILKIPVTVYQ